MSVDGAEMCPHCRGAGSWWGAIPVGGAGVAICTKCEASGEVCQCLECGDEMPEPKAAREGQFCSPCRIALDAPEMELAS